MLNTEIWKPIEDHYYEISSLGNVRRKADAPYKYKRGGYIKPYINNKGYSCIHLYKKSKMYKFQIHRLIAQAFIPNPDNLPEVNHIDGNPLNNSIENLEWCTHQYNMQHAWDTGLHKNYLSNVGKKRKSSTSQYHGVHLDRVRNKWSASVGYQNKTIPLGRFQSEEDAARAYDSYLKESGLVKLGYQLNFS